MQRHDQAGVETAAISRLASGLEATQGIVTVEQEVRLRLLRPASRLRIETHRPTF